MKESIKTIKGGVCAPKGFEAGAVSCGIKNPDSDRLDLALIYSTIPSHGAGVFTENAVKAAPVVLSESYIKAVSPRAIIANSGNANACTGIRGMDDARTMATATAKALGINRREVLVCSTGIIGMPLPMDRMEGRFEKVVEALKPNNSKAAARAIMTSDTKPKSVSVEIEIDGQPVRIGGIAKGAGMINPNMATMLCFITTDAKVSESELRAATRKAVAGSFNRISIDGDMSTNDTVIVLANGAAENREIKLRREGSEAFREALSHVMLKLARKIVTDGERVTKLVEVSVRGASSAGDAEKIARAVANSKLVKCSWNGEDPNWGRIIHAIGYAGARVRPEMVDIYFNGLAACQHGLTAETDLKKLEAIVKKKKFTVGIEMNLGKANYSILTSDLSPEYVDFNRSEYAASRHQAAKQAE